MSVPEPDRTGPESRRRRPSREGAVLARLAAREWRRVSGPFRALDLRFEVRTTSDAPADYLEHVLASFVTDEPARHVYSIVDNGERFKTPVSVYYGGQRLVRLATEPLAVSYVLWHLNRAVVGESPRYLLLHASAAVADDAAIVFPAPMESGKSTLIAGLLQRGFGYLTDEVVAIDPATALVHPYPKPLSIDPGSWEVLGALRPALDARLAPYAGAQWHLPVSSVRSESTRAPARPRLLVGPRYEPGSRTTLEPISGAEGVLLLAENAFNFPAHGTAGLETLATIARGCDCYRLTYSSLDEACRAISTLVERLGVPA